MHTKTWFVVLFLSLRRDTELLVFGSGVPSHSADVRIVIPFFMLSVISCHLVRQLSIFLT